MATKITAARDSGPEPPDDAAGADARTLPLLPHGLTCFETSEPLDPEALLATLCEEVAARRAETEDNPFANPIQLLALALGRRLHAGTLSLAAIEQLVQRLTVKSFA